ncbi:chaperone modulatory protein CbpM [Oxalobacteraceae bacterium GrIS 2.11]
MAQTDFETGLLIDDLQLTLEEFARACQRDIQWVENRIDAQLIGVARGETFILQFTSADLKRARRLASVEAMFEANEDVAGLVVDLIEENERLKKALSLASLK